MAGEPTGLLHAGGAASLPGAGNTWIDSLREAGARRFTGLGLPTRKVEDWKYTDLRALSGSTWDLPVEPADLANIEDDASAVLVNGCWMRGHRPLPDGVELVSLARAIEDGDEVVRHHLGSVASLARKHFVALNTAWLADGLVLKVADGVTIDEPLRITLAGAPGAQRLAWHPRNLIVLGREASLTLVVNHVGTGDYLANLVEEVVLERGARLRHYRVQDDSPDAVNVSTTEVKVAGDATYENFVLATGAGVGRNQIAVELGEPGASVRLDGACLGRHRQQLDTTTVIDHAAPRCTSREAYRYILDDSAKGIFQGRVTVRKHAGGTDSHQSSKTLLLSGKAGVDAKPELEIYADDVSCGHGATVGEIDQDALFYMRSRGIPLEEARDLLIAAFIEGAVETIASPEVQALIRDHALAWRTRA
ncbi:MAG: Fe-S cluster assembly protein SufD [Alphaproteobacteria bacterium]|nr:Fe-S cluster assembly protein SufD [Alphaproteobacteria bacterium]